MKRLLSLVLAGILVSGTAAAETTVAELAPWLDSIGKEELRRQLDELPSPSATDKTGRTLLHHAVCDAPDQVPLLLNSKVDPGLADDSGATPLHHFFRCEHPADAARLDNVTTALLNAGAPIDVQDAQGRTPLHAALTGMPQASGSVDIYRDAALLMLARGAPADTADRQGLKPLHLAAQKSSVNLVNVLLDAGAEPDSPDNEGRTPLWWAAGGRDNLAVFEIFLAQGANPAIFPQGGPSAAARAAGDLAWRKLDLLLQLLPEPQLPQGLATPVLARSLWENAPLPVAKRIHATGANIPDLPAHGGGDLAWRLAERQDTQALDWLLANDFPLNQRPPSGYPPLFFASLPATRLLLERGADPAIPSAKDGTVMAAFIEPPEKFRQPEPHFGETKVERLLQAGYPVNLRDPQGRTALERAVRGDHLWLVKRLLIAGADPTLASGDARSVVPYALANGRLPMIRALIRAVDDFPQRHDALLLEYIKDGGTDAGVADLLLASGTDPRATDTGDNTALLWAARNEQWNLVRLLLDNGARREHTNANGCDLDCYTWKMPETLAARIRRSEAPTLLERIPRLNDRATGFFAITLSPMLALYLLIVAWRMHQHRGLLAPSADALVAALTTLVISSMLFYRCDQCLLPDPHQAPATALLALLLFSGLRLLRR